MVLNILKLQKHRENGLIVKMLLASYIHIFGNPRKIKYVSESLPETNLCVVAPRTMT